MKTKDSFQDSNHKKIFIKVAMATAFFFTGLLFGFFIFKNSYKECSEKFSFINPVFACLEKVTINKKAYTDLKLNLMSFIEKETREGRANEVGVFFRDLKAGPTLGINDRTDFIPASLLKLPHVLSIMRLEEESDVDLSQQLMYNNNALENKQVFPPEEIIKINTPYTIYELMERTLKYSDNLADELLVKHIQTLGNGHDLIFDTYRDLGILLNGADINFSSVGVKGYSSIFRLLYNSSFLNSDNSEKLLKILSESSFDEGLRIGVPSDINIAHKFGEREVSATDEKQLHDCGIIYYPNNPYLLCIMTKGKDLVELSKIIGHISGDVYREFDSRRTDIYKISKQ